MSNIMYIAQKGLVFDKSKKRILVIKYLDAKYNPEKIKGKYALPGGKMDFSERPEMALVREIKEEIGITVSPILPFYTWIWIYTRNKERVQITATAWLAVYESGIIKASTSEKETKLETAEWIDISKLKLSKFVVDEKPAIKKFLEYQKSNPFVV